MTKMTKRDFFNAVIALDGASAEVVDFATASIVALDASNAKRKVKAKEKTPEMIALETAITEVLGASTDALTAKEIFSTDVVSAIADINIQKVSARLTAMSKEELVTVIVPEKRTAALSYTNANANA